MASMTKKELLKEKLAELEERIDIFENVQNALKKENPKMAGFLNSAVKSEVISAIIVARLMDIVSSFFKVDSGAIKINKS